MERKTFCIVNSIAIFFLLIITTLPLWNAYMPWTINLLLCLLIIPTYLCLATVVLVQSILLFKKKYKNSYRILTILLLTTVLTLVIWKPFDASDFDRFQGYDYLTAKTGGVKDTFDAMMTLKLNRDGRYIQTHIIFNKTEVRGTYTVKGDTIFFNRTTTYHDYEDYQFAVLKYYPIGNSSRDTLKNCLILYKDRTNASGYLMHSQGQMLQDMKKNP